ncbi:MAG: hypothetical protein HY049_04145 [Acidobacteria bacterium]|nr:hypothetical protein [Acidobacteriota bacterium]
MTLRPILAAGLAAPLIFLTAPSPVAASGDPRTARSDSVSFDQIVDDLRRFHDTSRVAVGRDGAFDEILGHHPYPGSCATPLLIALNQAAPTLPTAARSLVARLGPAEDPLAPSRSLLIDGGAGLGAFRLRYRVETGEPGSLKSDDEDGDGIPDEAARIADRVRDAHASMSATLDQAGMPTAPIDAAGRVHDLEITDLPDGISGWLLPGAGEPRIVVDRDAVLSPDGPGVLRHQLAHLYQVILTPDESPWWYEAHALWAEDPAGVLARTHARAVTAYFGSAASGMEPDALLAWEGALVWPHFLIESGGAPRLLSRMWDEMASVPGNNTLAAMDTVLVQERGAGLAEHVRSFRIWNLFTGAADDGRHYSFGRDLPAQAPESARTSPSPLSVRGALPPLGATAIQIASQDRPGGWVVDFEGWSPGAWDVAILTLPANVGESPRLATLRVGADARGRMVIPWRDLAGVVVVVQNLAPGRGAALPYNLAARHDPSAPFDLLSFAAEAQSDSVALRWTTEPEIDHYLLHGITTDGFVEPTYATAVRLGQTAGEPGPH